MSHNIFYSVNSFFDKLEDRIRAILARVPIIYAFLGGVGIVLFWRGVWHFADKLESLGGWWGVVFSPEGSTILSVFILLLIGLFVSFFVGDVIILSGVKNEKKLVERTRAELATEITEIEQIEKKLEIIEAEIKHLEAQKGVLQFEKDKNLSH
jgi:hypothetical protein